MNPIEHKYMIQIIPEVGPISCENCGETYQIGKDNCYPTEYLEHINTCYGAKVVDRETFNQIESAHNECMDKFIEQINLENEFARQKQKERETYEQIMRERENLKERERQIAKEREERRAKEREDDLKRIQENSFTCRLLKFIGLAN